MDDKRFNVTKGICEECGNEDDLMPFGENGKMVCGACGMKDPKMAAAQFINLMMK